MLDRLIKRYGPVRYSQNYEELIIRDFFKDRRGGLFVDVGASHFRKDSTTYYLERHLGWRGIAIDGIEEYRRGYKEHRPRTRFFAYFVSDRSDRQADLHVVERDKRYSTGRHAALKRWQAGAKVRTRRVPTITLDDLLAREDVERIDLLSMDIELAEPAALAGFDIERYRPQLVCIEAHEPVRDRIAAYFKKHGYERIESYGKLDQVNHYYTPRGGPPAR